MKIKTNKKRKENKQQIKVNSTFLNDKISQTNLESVVYETHFYSITKE